VLSATVFTVMRVDIAAMGLSFATAIALLSGCGGGKSEAAASTPAVSQQPGEILAPGLADPPGASLVVGSGTSAGGIGTHCWANACRDMVGPITGAALATMQDGEQAQIVFDEPDPNEVVYRWIAAPGPDDTPRPSNGQLVWGTLGPEAFTTPGASPEAPQEPGRYILVVFARWDGKGDVSYGWYVEVP
jgi:hypothetical protein